MVKMKMTSDARKFCASVYTHTCRQTDRPRTVSLLVLDAVIGFAPSSSAASPVF